MRRAAVQGNGIVIKCPLHLLLVRVALLQRPGASEVPAFGMVLLVHIAQGVYRPGDNCVLCVDLAEYFKLKKHYNTAAYNLP